MIQISRPYYNSDEIEAINKEISKCLENGILVNGFIRDIEFIKEIPIGVYAKNSYPMKTDKLVGVGEKNVNFNINNLEINIGEWVYVDQNGFVISKKELIL